MITETQQLFLERAVARKKLFLVLSLVGIAVAVGCAIWFIWQNSQLPNYDLSIRMVLVVLILLNARQNLRQYKYAQILESLKGPA